MLLDRESDALASASLARHLARGAIGFGLIGSALALTPSVGAAALLLAPLGMVALRGCPTCWIAGLIQTVSAGRLRRTCGEGGCTLHAHACSTIARGPGRTGPHRPGPLPIGRRAQSGHEHRGSR
jgi:hypothetical protein